jgi:hypothetical protein
MSDESIYPHATRELNEQRTRLAPGPAEALDCRPGNPNLSRVAKPALDDSRSRRIGMRYAMLRIENVHDLDSADAEHIRY